VGLAESPLQPLALAGNHGGGRRQPLALGTIDQHNDPLAAGDMGFADQLGERRVNPGFTDFQVQRRLESPVPLIEWRRIVSRLR
jgi:hypothetical protein